MRRKQTLPWGDSSHFPWTTHNGMTTFSTDHRSRSAALGQMPHVRTASLRGGTKSRARQLPALSYTACTPESSSAGRKIHPSRTWPELSVCRGCHLTSHRDPRPQNHSPCLRLALRNKAVRGAGEQCRPRHTLSEKRLFSPVLVAFGSQADWAPDWIDY